MSGVGSGKVTNVPHAMLWGLDGTCGWVARCPRCAGENMETIVRGREEESQATCQVCGTMVEVRLSGVFTVARQSQTPSPT